MAFNKGHAGASSIFVAPELDLDDLRVLAEIAEYRKRLADVLRVPRRWNGGLRRTLAARAIQGSNTIEGFTVTDDDAVAAVDDEPPLTADEATWAEILGYRRVLTYILNLATEPGFTVDETAIRSMHFMLLEHDLHSSPGRYRTSGIYVRDDAKDRNVYEGPDPDLVPGLMREFTRNLATQRDQDPLVMGAMAHLNLVMIHPFRDGNGRMARVLQTAVLARDRVLEPTFSSIEEWLGANTHDYYAVLGATGHGTWNPKGNTSNWVKFNLRAHHMQAQTVQRRFQEASDQWNSIDELLARNRLGDRLGNLLFDALLGHRITRPSYLKLIPGLDERTATRDLAAAHESGLLEAHGERRGRYYVAGEPLKSVHQQIRQARDPLVDPYPTLMAEVHRTLSAPPMGPLRTTE